MTAAIVRDVAPRDGLQAEAPLPTEERVELILRLVDSGVSHLELVSFMRDDLVPAMAGAEQVVEAVGERSGVVRYGLVANVRGAERAAKTSLDAFTFTLSASEAYSLKNTRQTIAESLTALGAVVQRVARPVDVVVSCAFGSPFDDVDLPHDLPPLVAKIRAHGAAAVTLADTTGLATPRRITDAIALVGTDVGLHLHETRGTGVLNAYAGVRAGVRRFDSSVGGIGGSPFAPNAAGNVATESLVALLHDEGLETGINEQRLLDTGRWLQARLGHQLPSPLLQLS
jgi:hydroxymethylglutaryl-CoA lyase